MHIRSKDLNAILSTLSIISLTNDLITYELLNLIYSLLDSSLITNEMVVDLFSESNMIEGLYSLLILNHLSSETKEIIFKILNIFLQSKRLSQQTRALLRLETNHIGFGGIISGMAINELTPAIVHEVLNIIITSGIHSFQIIKSNLFFLLRFINCCTSFKYCFNTL